MVALALFCISISISLGLNNIADAIRGRDEETEDEK